MKIGYGLVFVAVNALAAPFAVEVGDSRLGMDAPAGFSDTGFTGSPRLQEIAEALTSPSNRILLFAIADGDLRKFMVGDPPDLRRYMLVATPKALERERVSAATFSQLVADALQGLGPAAPPGRSFSEFLDAQPPAKTALLAELRRDADVVSVLQGTRLPPQRRDEENPQYVLSTTTLMLLRGKALNVSVYSPLESPADVEWIRSITARWVGALQRLNNR